METEKENHLNQIFIFGLNMLIFRGTPTLGGSIPLLGGLSYHHKSLRIEKKVTRSVGVDIY